MRTYYINDLIRKANLQGTDTEELEDRSCIILLNIFYGAEEEPQYEVHYIQEDMIRNYFEEGVQEAYFDNREGIGILFQTLQRGRRIIKIRELIGMITLEAQEKQLFYREDTMRHLCTLLRKIEI